ncbi:MAG: DUF4231 domain-containing protein [Candidatus Aminicenantes bacterium]|nr:DUF4231 domain-containing protein [Candidatus Aminicenantes bacterium]NIM85116.1 DUF4231 domain-containing protein [Candidatus Aminicenantes bacterium]NIN24626.1 DUF4231 domain-containing protein [Candidatus Aminicenantes bacterium]NIN48387.1 DUF4231 domain-containing protein [Candidatus Aminicenantes bacterium]NIN91290.1 DUF4231 domain-containing protein [Candidatus Aminicenantes bacterium]
MSAEQSPKHDSVLTDAWQKFADYDLNSIKQQKSFNRLQFWILLLGGLATVLALVHTQLVKISSIFPASHWVEIILRYTVIVAPVTVSILMTITNLFKPGNKWLPLRRAAEEIKSGIYRYRTLSNLPPSKEEGTEDSNSGVQRKDILREKLSQVGSWLMETDVSKMALGEYKGSLPPYMDESPEADKDDGFSPLTPDRYLEVRLGDQVNYYTKRTKKMERQLKLCQWLIVIFGGIGTFLAAIGLQLWVALTVTLVGIFTTFLEYRQVDNNLMIYNQAKYSLIHIKGWWSDLPDVQKKDPGNIRQMVDSTEKVLQSELSRWVQNMQKALEDLWAKQKEVKNG